MADFTRIATITSSNPIMIARVKSPLKSIADVVDAAKAHPGKLTYGSGTVGQQLIIEMLKVRANVSMLHVPYKGGSQVITDLLGGHVDLAATASANYINLRTKVVALAIASEARFKHLPEVPTMVELGYPGFMMGAWLGILQPKRSATGACLLPDAADRRDRQFAGIRRLRAESRESGRVSYRK